MQLLVASLGVALAACALPTHAQQAQQKIDCWKQHRAYEPYVRCVASQIEAIDPARREHYGEEYGAEKYLQCALARPPGDTYCDRHRLKRRPELEYWPSAGKVPPPKWPEAPKEAVYRKGMKPKEYFDALCKAEAGEFIFKIVDNVQGVYQVRPRLRAGTYELRDRHVMEDPYGYSGTDHSRLQDSLVQPPFGGYRFLETPNLANDAKTKYVRFYRGDPIPGRTTQYMVRQDNGNLRGVVVPYVVHAMGVDTLFSGYGFTWRGIKRDRDRENSIAGGEFAVVELSTGEILGIRRGFAMTRMRTATREPNWEIAAECPPNILGSRNRQFLQKVLKSLPE
jgi:hypothetical protein